MQESRRELHRERYGRISGMRIGMRIGCGCYCAGAALPVNVAKEESRRGGGAQ